MFCPEALYTTRMPKTTMSANTPVSGPSSPSARSVRPPGRQGTACARRREFVEYHHVLVNAHAVCPMTPTEQRPDQGADDGREPAAEGGDRIAGGAVDPEKHELIARQQRENSQRIATRRRTRACAGADEWPRRPSASAPGHAVRAPRRVITSSARPEKKANASPPARGDSMRPIEHHQHQKIRTKRIHRSRQRDDRQRQGHQCRERHGQRPDRGCRASFLRRSGVLAAALAHQLGGLRLEPHEHQFARPVERGGGLDVHVRQRLRRIALDLGDGAYGVAGAEIRRPGRKSPTDRRRPRRRSWTGRAASAAFVSPVPTAMVRRPLRLICTGMACVASLTRMISLVNSLDPRDLAEHAAGVEHRLPDVTCRRARPCRPARARERRRGPRS